MGSIRDSFVDEWLDRAIAEFDSNPLCSPLIRRLAQDSPEAFVHAALERLGDPEQSAALQLLTGLILCESAVFEFLSRTGNTAHERSRRVFGRLIAIEPLFDVKLAKRLPDRSGLNHHQALTGLRGARALELLDEFSLSRRLVPILAHLADSADPHLRVRAILFVGRRVQSAAWAEKQLRQHDPKMRALVIESIWGVDTDEARNLLRRCKADRSDLVAANSLVGLHLIGEPGIAEEIRSMAAAGSDQARAAAAQAMERIRFEAPKPAIVKEPEATKTAPEEAAENKVPEPVEQPVEIVQEQPTFNLRLDGSSFATKRNTAQAARP